jgi:hypothetical protein
MNTLGLKDPIPQIAAGPAALAAPAPALPAAPQGMIKRAVKGLNLPLVKVSDRLLTIVRSLVKA